MKHPNIISINAAVSSAKAVQAGIDGRWVPARPEGYASLSFRIKAAWLVFTGKADALTWGEGQ